MILHRRPNHLLKEEKDSSPSRPHRGAVQCGDGIHVAASTKKIRKINGLTPPDPRGQKSRITTPETGGRARTYRQSAEETGPQRTRTAKNQRPPKGPPFATHATLAAYAVDHAGTHDEQERKLADEPRTGTSGGRLPHAERGQNPSDTGSRAPGREGPWGWG